MAGTDRLFKLLRFSGVFANSVTAPVNRPAGGGVSPAQGLSANQKQPRAEGFGLTGGLRSSFILRM